MFRRGEGPGDRGRAGERAFQPRTADEAVDVALVAWRRRRGWSEALTVLHEGALAGTDAGAGAAADARARVDEALGRRLLAVLGDAWEAGWQPADLARVVERHLGRAAGRLVATAIVREAALYPPAAVPPRWRQQVDELAQRARRAGRTGRRRADDARWAVPATAAGAEDRRRGHLRTAVEALSWLRDLPPVPTLGPRPGRAGAGPGAAGPGAGTSAAGDGAGGTGPDPRLLQRVRGLLAKAESTTFSEEAEALTAKAQELMARHAIDAALVAAGPDGRGLRADLGGRRLAVDDPYAGAKAMLLGAIAEANRSKSVWTKDFGYATVFGDEGDLDAVELLYTSLLVQAARAMLAEPTGRDRPTAGSTRSYRQSFLVAYAVRIGERLREAVEAAADAATAGDSVRRDALLPVLAGRVEAAQEAVEAAYPQVKTTTLSAKDWAGWHAGQQAAERAELGLHTPVSSGSPATED